ncbi:hypothetical protein [Methylobacterium sp. Leaf102]|uniref:hypothetical protein n=1 Tax=Methylobacterium sp. Leaf102 TaxID=1736253 RepID=UPI0012E941B9|nr:hypothetical protein [Methylobacterium sp. Leaf102]
MVDKVKSFGAFGVKLKSVRGHWSGISSDGKVVVLALWGDELNYKTIPISYDCFDRPDYAEWGRLAGNTARKAHLRHSISECGSLFRVVIGHAKDKLQKINGNADYNPQLKLLMKITEFNDETGEFRAINVST